MFESILCQVTEYDPDVLESLIELAVEIAREGREGRRVGTLFTLGDETAVLSKSRPLILDPLVGHPESSRHVTNLNLRGTIKELAQLDGGFVVSREGIVLSACRYLDAVAAQVDVPLGLGSRHIAAANMSAVTKAVGIVVSESSVVRLFCHGQLVGEIIPEVWMMDHAAHLRDTAKRETSRRTDDGESANPIRAGPYLRPWNSGGVFDPLRAIREFRAAIHHSARCSNGGARRPIAHLDSRTRGRRLRANRPGHVDWAIGEKLHPHRRICRAIDRARPHDHQRSN